MTKLRDKVYRLADDRSGASCLIRTGKKGNLTIFDEGKNTRRAIKHCPNQKSIFIDEQDEHALVEPIIFIQGYLEVSRSNPITQEFLDKHPSNVENGGGWFEEVDDEQEAKDSIVDEELKMDIRYAVREMANKKDEGLHELSAVVAVLLDSVDEASSMGIEGLKRIIYNEIDTNPYYFANEEGKVTIFDDDSIKRKYLTLRAIKEGIIRKSANGKEMLWAKDSKFIAKAPASMDLIEYFSNYLTTDDGILVLEEIVRRS
jgi:hypothetical protein